MQPACTNSTMPPVPSFPPASSLCFCQSLSSFQTPKQKFHPKQPRRTHVKSNNPPTKLQAVLLFQPTPPTLLHPGGHCVHCSASKKGTALTLDLSFSKHLSKEVSSTGSLGCLLTIDPPNQFGPAAPAEELQIQFGQELLCQKFDKDLREEG